MNLRSQQWTQIWRHSSSLRSGVLVVLGLLFSGTVSPQMLDLAFSQLRLPHFTILCSRSVFKESDPSSNEEDYFAIYTEVSGNKRIYLRPTEPEQSGKPRANRIRGHELPESEFASPKNFVFLPGPEPTKSDCISLPEHPLLPADRDGGRVKGVCVIL